MLLEKHFLINFSAITIYGILEFSGVWFELYPCFPPDTLGVKRRVTSQHLTYEHLPFHDCLQGFPLNHGAVNINSSLPKLLFWRWIRTIRLLKSTIRCTLYHLATVFTGWIRTTDNTFIPLPKRFLIKNVGIPQITDTGTAGQGIHPDTHAYTLSIIILILSGIILFSNSFLSLNLK